MSTDVKRVTNHSGSRYYELPDGTRLASVTTILGVIAKPALVPWAAKREREMVVEAACELYADLPAGPKMSALGYAATLRKRIPLAKAHQIETERAFEIGREAHDCVEWTLRKQLGQITGPMPALSAESATAFAAWEEWAAATAFKPVMVEQMVWSREWRYAGTCDVLAEIMVDGESRLAVGDWKTSKGIYPEYGLQIAAYAYALQEMGHALGPVHGFCARFPKTPTDHYEVKVYKPEELAEMLRVFLCAREVYEWQRAATPEEAA